MLVEAKRRKTGLPLRGLRDVFSSQLQYTPNSNVLDIGVDNSLQNRVNAIVTSGIVGAYNGYNVYNESAPGKFFVELGLAFQRF